MKSQNVLAIFSCVIALSGSAVGQTLLTDSFVAANQSPINSDLASRQSGTLAPTSYTSKFANGDPNTNFILNNSMWLTVGADNVFLEASNSLNHNFTESGLYTMAFDTNPGSSISFFNFGKTSQNETFNSAGGASFVFFGPSNILQLYIGGDVVYSAADILFGGTSSIIITLSNSGPWDGTGSALIDISINGTAVDLNGTGVGNSYSTAGFAGNYLTFGANSAFAGSGLTGVSFDNLSIVAIPEPGTGLLLSIGFMTLICVCYRRHVRAR